MKTILKWSLVLLLAIAANGCSTTGENTSSGSAPTVSGSVSVGATKHF